MKRLVGDPRGTPSRSGSPPSTATGPDHGREGLLDAQTRRVRPYRGCQRIARRRALLAALPRLDDQRPGALLPRAGRQFPGQLRRPFLGFVPERTGRAAALHLLPVLEALGPGSEPDTRGAISTMRRNPAHGLFALCVSLGGFVRVGASGGSSTSARRRGGGRRRGRHRRHQCGDIRRQRRRRRLGGFLRAPCLWESRPHDEPRRAPPRPGLDDPGLVRPARLRPPRPTPGADSLHYQDGGHSHWHDSLIWGEDLTDIAITRRGQDRRQGPLQGWSKVAPQDVGNKAIALKNCRNVTLGTPISHGGWFGILATGVGSLVIDGSGSTPTATGWTLTASAHNVRVSNCSVNSPKDGGICLKELVRARPVPRRRTLTISDCLVSGYDEARLLGREPHHRVRDAQEPTGDQVRDRV